MIEIELNRLIGREQLLGTEKKVLKLSNQVNISLNILTPYTLFI